MPDKSWVGKVCVNPGCGNVPEDGHYICRRCLGERQQLSPFASEGWVILKREYLESIEDTEAGSNSRELVHGTDFITDRMDRLRLKHPPVNSICLVEREGLFFSGTLMQDTCREWILDVPRTRKVLISACDDDRWLTLWEGKET